LTTLERESRPRIKRLVVGRPKSSSELDETLLPKRLALPIFASDALSSVAYATEAALVVLLAASAAGRSDLLPVSIAIAGLLAIVIASYQQTVRVYESSGGAYVVAKDNLGTLPSLVAAAALLTDYVLTVAVSVAAGVVALASAVPSLGAHRLGLSLACIALITIANLRGVRESGLAFAIPTYAFIASMLALVFGGAARCLDGQCGPAVAPEPMTVGVGTIGLFVLLRAFASGSAALTGVEAIANGVSAFRRPQSRNASRTLGILGVLAVTFFLGVSYLAIEMRAVPNEGGYPSLVSQIARVVFPSGSSASFMYYAVQASTVAILILAANTAYQGFPRLAALLARDRFFARQFTNLGDRLVFSNGVIVLAATAAGLIWVFDADVEALIHLYVIGVFTAFTLSQTGMVRYWLRASEPGWRHRALINGVGALATFVVTLVVIWTKFAAGAWMVIIAIPLLVLIFLGIRRHYRKIARRLRAGTAAVRAAGIPRNQVVIVTDSVDVATESALWYARRIANGGEVRALHAPGRGTDTAIRPRWLRLAGRELRLEVLDPAEGRIDAVLEELWKLPRGERDGVTVVIPEQFRHPSLLAAARRTAFRLKLRLLSEPGLVVADVPAISDKHGPDGWVPTRLVTRILVADVNAASMRALNYAQSLAADDMSAISFLSQPEAARPLEAAWAAARIPVPLEIRDAPYRDIGEPLLEYIRELTADPEVAVNIVMPELVVRGWRRTLHNQRALYIKRLLLFEPRVILTSVPFQLFR
jgi:amino acid transporter